MVAGATISADLSDDGWLKALRDIGERHGTYSELGENYSAVFVEKSRKVLFVGFETLLGIRSISETGTPLAFDVCERTNWSHLTLITREQAWFRDPRVFSFFDRLADLGFFDTFDQVVFYGAGMCGYAAGVFSVAAPGATVLMIAPQATLDRGRTGWDDRFPSTRRLNFRHRYAYAPDMVDAAGQAIVIHDPEETEDALHASLFQGANVDHFRYRRGSAGAIEADLRSMALISQITKAAAEGALTSARLARLMRPRRRHIPYHRALLSRVMAEDRPELTVMLCRAVLKEQPLPRFKHQLEQAEKQLAKRAGRDLDDGAMAEVNEN